MLRYHQSIFNLMGTSPRISELAADLLNERQRECCVALPPSVLEWFSIEGAQHLLTLHSSGDRGQDLVSLEKLGLTLFDRLGEQWQPGELADELDPSWRRFLYLISGGENGFPLYVALDGSDDPPVYSDGSFWDDDEHFVVQLDRCNHTFSSFIFDWMAWPVIDPLQQGPAWSARLSAPPSAGELEHLKRCLYTGPQSHCSSSSERPLVDASRTNYRYFTRDALLWIRTGARYGEDDWSGTEWELRGASSGSLHSLLQTVCALPEVAVAFEPEPPTGRMRQLM
jgi:hypothetical protein